MRLPRFTTALDFVYRGAGSAAGQLAFSQGGVIIIVSGVLGLSAVGCRREGHISVA
jgi:hypothetical protein